MRKPRAGALIIANPLLLDKAPIWKARESAPTVFNKIVEISENSTSAGVFLIVRHSFLSVGVRQVSKLMRTKFTQGQPFCP